MYLINCHLKLQCSNKIYLPPLHLTLGTFLLYDKFHCYNYKITIDLSSAHDELLKMTLFQLISDNLKINSINMKIIILFYVLI